jgi:hypothetical protein
MRIILCINRIYFYSANYKTLFDSLLYSKNIAHKYLPLVANNNHICLIN